MTFPSFAAPDGDGVRIAVRVTPRARKSEVVGVVDAADGRPALAIRLRSPPVDGAANRALVELLAARLGVPRSSIAIVGGEKSRLKTLRVEGVAQAALAALAP